MCNFSQNAHGSFGGSASNLADEPRRQEASVHRDTLAGDISSRGKAKKCDQPGHLFRFPDATKGRSTDDAGSDAFIRQKALCQISFDEPRSD